MPKRLLPDIDPGRLFDALPGAYLLLAPDLTIIGANAAYLAATRQTAADLVGRSVFGAFPDNPDDPNISGMRNLRTSLEQVLASKAPDKMAIQRYDIRRPEGGFEPRWWDPINSPMLDDHGDLRGIVHHVRDVTDLMQVENALHETEQRYRLASQATTDAIWDWDLTADRIRWNAAVRTLFGYSAEEIGPTGEWWKLNIHTDDRERVTASIQAAINGVSDSWADEYRFRRADGSYAAVLDRGTVLRDEQGRAIRMIGAMLDLTTQKQTEAALRTSEAKFQAIVNSIDQMIWATRPDGFHDYYNDRWYEFTGAPYGSTDGESWNGMFHPDDQELAWELWRRSLETGEPYHIEYRLRHRSGQYRWVIGRAQPVRDEAGDIIRWYGTCTDIDELKRTADELRRTSAMLRLIGDSTPDLIYAKDRQSRVLYANAAHQRVVGRKPEELIGRTDMDFAPNKAEAEKILANDRLVMETGQTVDLDEVFTGPDEQTRHYRSVKSPLRDATGLIIGLVGITSDMTERRRTEERERLLAREVDHRAKNLLAVVQSVVQLTRADDIAGFTAAITGRIRSLARAHSLLAASRWEGADLRQLVSDEMAPFAGAGGSRIRIDGPAVRLRPEAAQALALVLHELTTNAAKYGALSVPDGWLDVTWQTAPDDLDSLLLCWRENGGPPVAPPTRRGFGSTVMRASVEKQLKGRVSLDWRPEGLVTELTIPAEQLAAGTERRPRRPANTSDLSRTADVRGRRVLVLEDEALIAMQIEEGLEKAGCAIVGPASRVADAFELLYANGVDAALLDVNVAGEQSFAIADILVSKRIPFAFVTGFDAASTMPERFQSVPVVAKPFATSELVATIEKLGRETTAA